MLCWAGFLVREAIAGFASVDYAQPGIGDLAVDWKAAQLFWKGISPYSPKGLQYVDVPGFGHPPTTPFWVLPLADLSRSQFAIFIATLNLALALGLVAIGVYTLQFPMPALITVLVFGAIQAVPPAIEQARVIQISVWIAFAYALAWRWLRRGRDVSAGLALGFACTLKFFPGLMILYLALERRWRAVAAAAGSFLAVAAVMTWRWGFSSWPLFFEQQKTIAERWMPNWRNASLHGVIRRAFVSLCTRAPTNDPRATAVIVIIAVLTLGATVWLWRRARERQPTTVRFDRTFALTAVLSAFLNPWIWEHYFYLLVVPALIAVRAIVTDVARLARDWSVRRPSRSRLASTAASTLVGAGALGVAVLSYQNLFRANAGAHDAVCRPTPPAVHQWLFRQAIYYDLINWLPWVLFSVLFGVLLALRVPEPDPGH